MFIQKPKRKTSDLPAHFAPNGLFTAYLLCQFHFFFLALGTTLFMPFSGIFIRQPLMMLWWVAVAMVGLMTFSSILHLWEGDRRGFQGLVLAHALYFLYFVGYSIAVEPSGVVYLVMLALNTLLLVMFVYPKRHLLW